MSSSPWGQIDHVEKVFCGVSFVSTPSHGGLRISRSWAEKNLTKEALAEASDWDNNYFWYEEDCDWAIPVFEHPEIDLKNVESAKKTLSCSHIPYLYKRDLWDLIDVEFLKREIERNSRYAKDYEPYTNNWNRMVERNTLYNEILEELQLEED